MSLHFAMATCEPQTGPGLWRIALWDCLEGILTQSFLQRSPKQSHNAIRFSTDPVTRGIITSNWPTTSSSRHGIVFVVPRPPFTRAVCIDLDFWEAVLLPLP